MLTAEVTAFSGPVIGKPILSDVRGLCQPKKCLTSQAIQLSQPDCKFTAFNIVANLGQYSKMLVKQFIEGCGIIGAEMG